MNFGKIVLVIATLSLGAFALAGENIKSKMAIAVIDDGGDGEVRIELDSEDLGFNLHEMQEGENRSVVDESGRTILITREADGFTFDVDGKTIKMPLLHGGHHGAVRLHGDGDASGDVTMHVMRDASFGMGGAADGVMVISGKPIDEATQQAIESLLQSAGQGDEVRFIDRESGHDGLHRIRVIEKKVEVSE